MEVAPGGAGEAEVTRSRRPRVNLVLYAVVLVLATTCVVGAVYTWQQHEQREAAVERQLRYGNVKQAAIEMAEAFINIDYRHAKQSIKAVKSHATGDFKKQYSTATSAVIKVIKDNKSVMTGQAVWAGIASLDGDHATVLVATSGTVSNERTEGKAVPRNFRLKLTLVRKHGEWLTNNLAFVG